MNLWRQRRRGPVSARPLSEHSAMYGMKRKTIGSIIVLAILAGWCGVDAVRAADISDRRAQVPAADPRIVLTWDSRRADLPRNKDGPTLQVRADGGVAVTDPHGGGRPVEARLSPAHLEQL